MKKLIAASLIASMSALPVFAGSPSFNFVEGGYLDFEDGDGIELRGNYELNSNFFLNADFQTTSADDGLSSIDTDYLLFGAGYKMALNETTSGYAMLNYVDLSADSFLGTLNDDGYQLAVGVRSQVTDATQVYGEIAANDLSLLGGRTELNIGVRQKFSNDFGGYVEYKRDDFGGDGFSLGLTLDF